MIYSFNLLTHYYYTYLNPMYSRLLCQLYISILGQKIVLVQHLAPNALISILNLALVKNPASCVHFANFFTSNLDVTIARMELENIQLIFVRHNAAKEEIFATNVKIIVSTFLIAAKYLYKYTSLLCLIVVFSISKNNFLTETTSTKFFNIFPQKFSLESNPVIGVHTYDVF